MVLLGAGSPAPGGSSRSGLSAFDGEREREPCGFSFLDPRGRRLGHLQREVSPSAGCWTYRISANFFNRATNETQSTTILFFLLSSRFCFAMEWEGRRRKEGREGGAGVSSGGSRIPCLTCMYRAEGKACMVVCCRRGRRSFI